MSNTTKRPVIEWLRTIADPIVRESAIRQCEYPNVIVTSLRDAIIYLKSWDDTKEGYEYWFHIALNGQLATIVPSETDWMQEVHQMD